MTETEYYKALYDTRREYEKILFNVRCKALAIGALADDCFEDLASEDSKAMACWALIDELNEMLKSLKV